MEKKYIIKKITNAFSTVLEHDDFELKEETTAEDVSGWESITHMMIIAEIENTFGIRFKLMDLMQMNTIGDLIQSVIKEVDTLSKNV